MTSGRRKNFNKEMVRSRPVMYRPFTKQWRFSATGSIEAVYRMPRVSPSVELSDLVLAVTGKGEAVTHAHRVMRMPYAPARDGTSPCVI